MDELTSYIVLGSTIIGILGSFMKLFMKIGKLISRVDDLEGEMAENKPHIDEIPVILTVLKHIQTSIEKIEARDAKVDSGALKQQVENNETRSINNSTHIAKIFDKLEGVNKSISEVSGEVKQILGILSSRGQDSNRI